MHATDDETTGHASLTFQVETCFRVIAQTRMEGVPILHPKIGVALRGLRLWNNHLLGVLVTPWFMNIVLFPQPQADEAIHVGSKRHFALPAGSYEFIRYHEAKLGGYWGCSLFSPMFEFEDDDAAIATADEAVELLMTPDPEDVTQDTPPPATATPPARPSPPSRRALLGLGAGKRTA